MDIKEAINQRHSVRAYLDKPIENELKEKLLSLMTECNRDYGLNIQFVTDEPKAFDTFLAHYGKFSGVKNYFALIGKKSDDLEEKVGYCGEKIALYAQALGLNTCWVALTYKKVKDAYVVNKDEKLISLLAVGYGKTQGVAHKSKDISKVSVAENAPEWFIDGVKAALLAPTALNLQKFVFTLTDGNKVSAKAKRGTYSKIDLGIVKYHFEIGAGIDNFTWL